MATTARPAFPREGAYVDEPRRPPVVRRISWGAIIAGVVVVLVVQMALMLLGLAIGTATIDPAAADTPGAYALGVGGAWWLATTAIAVFVGGWVAGRLAGMPSRTDGTLHGVITWAAATLVAARPLPPPPRPRSPHPARPIPPLRLRDPPRRRPRRPRRPAHRRAGSRWRAWHR